MGAHRKQAEPLALPPAMPKLSRAEAEALGYPTKSLAEFERGEFAKYLSGDQDALYRETSP